MSQESQRVFQNLLLFCFVLLYNKSLKTGPLGNSEFCFPRISLTSSRETMRFSGNKIHCSPRDQSLSVNCVLVTSVVGFYNEVLKLARKDAQTRPSMAIFVVND